MNTVNKTELLKDSLSKYNSYDPQTWEKAYFNDLSGGYLIVDKERIEHSKVSKNEKAKFDKERAMAMVFAENGYKIEMLKEIPRVPSPDVTINGILGELKSLSGDNNIVREAKDAVRKKKAEAVLFEFEKVTDEIHNELLQLKKYDIHGYYYFSNNHDKIYNF